MANTLTERLLPWRNRIDELDRQILELLNERARAALEVGKIKQDFNTEEVILKPEREAELTGTLGLMVEIGYLRMEEVPGIPRLPTTPAAASPRPSAGPRPSTSKRLWVTIAESTRSGSPPPPLIGVVPEAIADRSSDPLSSA